MPNNNNTENEIAKESGKKINRWTAIAVVRHQDAALLCLAYNRQMSASAKKRELDR